MSLIAELFAGSLDIVGDVHGEIDALRQLLARLGYDAEGAHADGRRLVFVGDLADRGPDSPAVVALVARLAAAGRAQCVLGNHELNVLRCDRKQGNGWFFGEVDDYDGAIGDERWADDGTRESVRAFFGSLPVALERDDLRVVHAAWDDDHVDRLRQVSNLLAFSDDEEARIAKELTDEGLASGDAAAELVAASGRLRPKLDPVAARWAVEMQNRHAVKLCTSGVEAMAESEYRAGGKWRLEKRVPWWEKYDDEPTVVVGHYWRTRVQPAQTNADADLFAGAAPAAMLGAAGKVMCVDYSIGRLASQRRTGVACSTALAAFQWPESRLVFHDDK